MTPLLLALKQKQLEMVEFLLENGADVHTRDFLGRYSLFTLPKLVVFCTVNNVQLDEHLFSVRCR